MAGHTVCPRCGARDSFLKGFLPETCVCQRCMSQLDWREIPGCGPDCTPAGPEVATGTTAPTYVAAPMASASGDEDGEDGSGVPSCCERRIGRWSRSIRGHRRRSLESVSGTVDD